MWRRGPYCLNRPFAGDIGELIQRKHARWTLMPTPEVLEMLPCNLWVAPGSPCDWLRSEPFLKQVQPPGNWVPYAILGNKERILTSLLCHQDDVATPEVNSMNPGDGRSSY